MRRHLGDALSALLDDELAPDEAHRARAHLEGCGDCRAELERVGAGRTALRSLPPVEPPAGVLDGISARVGDAPAGGRGPSGGVVVPLAPRQRAGAALAVAVAASVALVVLGAGLGRPDDVAPPVDELAAGHAMALAAATGDVDALVEAGWREVPPSDVPPPYPVPRELPGGYRLVAAFDMAHGVHLLYRGRGEDLSLVEITGRVDRAALPAGGRVEEGDRWVWHARMGSWAVALVEGDGMVQAVVMERSSDRLMPVVSSAPDPRPLGFWQRLRRTCERTLDEFGLLD